MLSSAGFAKQPTDAHVDALAAATLEAVKPLLGIAMSGNVHAIRRVTELAANLSAEAMTLACMHQEAANLVARERTTWPLNISHDPVERRRALRLVTGPRKLPLGGTAPSPRPAPKPSSFTTPAKAAVLVALKAIEIERAFRVPSELFPVLQPDWSVAAAQLPDLDGTHGVAEQWFEVIWLYLCHRHRGAPEKSALRKLGEYELQPKLGPGAHDTAGVRASIQQALQRAFQRLLVKPTKRRRDTGRN